MQLCKINKRRPYVYLSQSVVLRAGSVEKVEGL